MADSRRNWVETIELLEAAWTTTGEPCSLLQSLVVDRADCQRDQHTLDRLCAGRNGLHRSRRECVAAAARVQFEELTGLAVAPLPVLFPHVFGFRLLMALLTDRRYPLPIWNALQIRNRLRQHLTLSASDVLDIETCIAGSRVLAKGMEVDLCTTINTRGALAWDSTVTFYYRGAFGDPAQLTGDSLPPRVDGTELAHWRAVPGQGWRFSRLTGDYNGIHWSNRYARAFGFRGAFHHPQRALGQALAHLPVDATLPAQRLDVWLRGQVTKVPMSACGRPATTRSLSPCIHRMTLARRSSRAGAAARIDPTR